MRMEGYVSCVEGKGTRTGFLEKTEKKNGLKNMSFDDSIILK
jgi:hypothetical protein